MNQVGAPARGRLPLPAGGSRGRGRQECFPVTVHDGGTRAMRTRSGTDGGR